MTLLVLKPCRFKEFSLFLKSPILAGPEKNRTIFFKKLVLPQLYLWREFRKSDGNWKVRFSWRKLFRILSYVNSIVDLGDLCEYLLTRMKCRSERREGKSCVTLFPFAKTARRCRRVEISKHRDFRVESASSLLFYLFILKFRLFLFQLAVFYRSSRHYVQIIKFKFEKSIIEWSWLNKELRRRWFGKIIIKNARPAWTNKSTWNCTPVTFICRWYVRFLINLLGILKFWRENFWILNFKKILSD